MVTTITGTCSGVNESFLRDALGSTIRLTDSSQTVQEQYTYDPYGNTSLSGTLGGSNYHLQFTGREDDYAGLYFMRSRYYNPAIARYMSRDPAGFAGGINLYAYASDDPVDFSDPTGMDWETILEGPGDVCGGCFPRGAVGVYVGPQYTFPAPVPNKNGIDRDVVPSYHGQNGGGLSSAEIELAQHNVLVLPTPAPTSTPSGAILQYLKNQRAFGVESNEQVERELEKLGFTPSEARNAAETRFGGRVQRTPFGWIGPTPFPPTIPPTMPP